MFRLFALVSLVVLVGCETFSPYEPGVEVSNADGNVAVGEFTYAPYERGDWRYDRGPFSSTASVGPDDLQSTNAGSKIRLEVPVSEFVAEAVEKELHHVGYTVDPDAATRIVGVVERIHRTMIHKDKRIGVKVIDWTAVIGYTVVKDGETVFTTTVHSMLELPVEFPKSFIGFIDMTLGLNIVMRDSLQEFIEQARAAKVL